MQLKEQVTATLIMRLLLLTYFSILYPVGLSDFTCVSHFIHLKALVNLHVLVYSQEESRGKIMNPLIHDASSPGLRIGCFTAFSH